MFEQIPGHPYGPVKLRHKINHHSDQDTLSHKLRIFFLTDIYIVEALFEEIYKCFIN